MDRFLCSKVCPAAAFLAECDSGISGCRRSRCVTARERREYIDKYGTVTDGRPDYLGNDLAAIFPRRHSGVAAFTESG
jgi:hypothetical protein